ncbi:hypothetical protein RRG08_043104 [Elysia crispata]|uniref:Uncharacterized protein n=1 Tax=Elysia crispata TaxID=231223 RepID=A0AAE0XY31_9GAST|nr:hypothetical protein RRG08_043104 [Elysia crispata]
MGTDLVRIYLRLAIELKVFPYLSRLKVCGTREGSTPGRRLSTRMEASSRVRIEVEKRLVNLQERNKQEIEILPLLHTKDRAGILAAVFFGAKAARPEGSRTVMSQRRGRSQTTEVKLVRPTLHSDLSRDKIEETHDPEKFRDKWKKN